MQHRSPPQRHWQFPPRDLASSVRPSIGSWWSRLSRFELRCGERARWHTARFAVGEGALTVWCRPNTGGGGSVAVWKHQGEGAGIGTAPHRWSRGRR